MNWHKKTDQNKRNTASNRSSSKQSPRVPSTRLPERTGRRTGSRPPIDPDLERFLTSPNDEFASSSQSPDDENLEVIIPEEVDSAYDLPQWRSLSDSHAKKPEARKEKASVSQIVHVPRPEPLFPGAFPATDRDATDSEKLFRILFRRFPVFLLVAIVVWSGVALYLSLVPPKYESTTTLLIDTASFKKEMDELPRLNSAGTGFGGGKLANQTLILRSSPELAQQTATELSSLRAENPNLARWTIFERHVDQARRGGTLASLLTKEYVNVQGGPSDDDEPDAISISVSSTDPAEAALIANVYSQTYVDEVDRLVLSHFEEALNYYQGRRDRKLEERDVLTDELKQFIREDGTMIGDLEKDHLLEQISNLNTSSDDTSIEIEEIKASIASLENEVGLMDGQLLAERAAHGIEDQLDKSYQRIADLNIETEKYYVKNPELRFDPTPSQDLTDMVNEKAVLLMQVDSLSQKYSNEITAVGGVDLRSYDGGISYMASLRRDLIRNRVMLDAAIAKHQAITTRLAGYELQLREMPEMAIDFEDISSRHSSATSQLNDLDNKIRLVEEGAGGRGAHVRVLSPAIEPTAPKIDPLIIAFLGGLLGLLAGVGAAFTSEKTDDRLYEKGDIERHDVEVISTIPRFKNVSRRSKRVFYERRISSEMLTILHPDSPASRPLRSIPLRIAGNTLKNNLFVFTGVDPKSGTSFMAANTAAAIARSGARVLLVDANVFSPSLTDILGLTDQARFDMSINSFADGKGIEAFSGRLPQLYAMALEAPDSQNPEYLLSNSLASFIERVRKQFDAVIVDAASLSRSTSALGLSQLADEMIVVVKSGVTNEDRLVEMLDDIRSSAGSRARVVLNAQGKMSAPVPSVRRTATS